MNTVAIFLIAGILLGALLAERLHSDKPLVRQVWLTSTLVGIVGARLAAIVDNGWPRAGFGLSSWGFGLGFLLASILYIFSRSGTSTRQRLLLLDSLAPGLAVTILVARLGCLIANCRHVGPFLPSFAGPATSAESQGWLEAFWTFLAQLPDVLVESSAIAFALALYFVNRERLNRGFRPGSLFLLGVISYSGLRFLLQLSGGSPGITFSGLSFAIFCLTSVAALLVQEFKSRKAFQQVHSA